MLRCGSIYNVSKIFLLPSRYFMLTGKQLDEQIVLVQHLIQDFPSLHISAADGLSRWTSVTCQVIHSKEHGFTLATTRTYFVMADASLQHGSNLVRLNIDLVNLILLHLVIQMRTAAQCDHGIQNHLSSQCSKKEITI